MPNQVENKVVLVTGGTGGIGRAIAQRFAREGCEVIVTGKTALEVRSFAKNGDGLSAQVLDVADAKAIRKLVNAFSRLDILVNCAGIPGYSASKGGVAQLTKSLAIAWASEGIRVNAIAPGWIETAMTRPLREDSQRNRAILERTPMKRWGKPADWLTIRTRRRQSISYSLPVATHHAYEHL